MQRERLFAATARTYGVGLAYMLRARLWLAARDVPPWPAIQDAWAAAEGSAAVRDALCGSLGAPQRCELLADGAQSFERRRALYEGARRTLDIATYYIQSDVTGLATLRQLAACAARGVRVRLLVDRFMTGKKRQEVRGMEALFRDIRAAGIELAEWHDPHRPYDSNHRKIMVADAAVAIVGGRNFADHYRGDAWRDVDLLVEGDCAAPLARMFEAMWANAGRGGDTAHTMRPWYDRVPADIADDPVMRFVIAAIGCARSSVDLELSYFAAHDSLCGALERCARRGVRVRLLTNSAESNDLPFTVWTAYEGARRLLEAGCEVHARRGAGRTLHCKYVVVDDEWISFGSHNLDYYSARFCCETNLQVRDAALAAQLTTAFRQGLAQASALSLDEVRPWLATSVFGRGFDLAFRDFQ
jgi:phosphatidylserine/phosphatidylglycerophosphate/cardiolipin synthase-like enzyme